MAGTRAARVAVLVAVAVAGQVGAAEARSQRWVKVLPGAGIPAAGAPTLAQSLVVRARAAGCRRARGVVVSPDRRPRLLTFGRRPRRVSVRLEAPAPANRLTLRARGCALLVGELTAVAVAAPAAPPAPPRVVLGTAVAQRPLSDPRYRATALSTFRSITPENELKMWHTQPRRGDYEFGAADEIVNFAMEHGLAVRGHSLIYGAQTPSWVGQLLLPQMVEQALEDHVTEVVTRYRHRIRVWDVVNEAFDAGGGWQRNAFFDALGPAYVEKAFQAARAADPTAKLYYNEFDAERPGPKQVAVNALVARLAERGLIDGVGLQMHVGVGSSPTFDELVETMRSYERLGLDVEITEMDVAARGDGSPTWLPLRLTRQADVYADAARACSAVAACKRLTVWGVSDRFTWLPAEQIPLLFDTEYQPKPALAALGDELR